MRQQWVNVSAAIQYTRKPRKKAIRLSKLANKQRNTEEALQGAGGRQLPMLGTSTANGNYLR